MHAQIIFACFGEGMKERNEENKGKKVLFLSGKGGAGKTSLAVATFLYLLRKGKKVHLFDCDVECPNAGLFIKNKRFLEEEAVIINLAKINKDKCINCGKCMSVCMFGSIMPSKSGHYKVIEESCKGCFACSLICPNNAIEKIEEKIGVIKTFFVKEKPFPSFFVEGSLIPGKEDSMPIIDGMLKKAKAVGDYDYLIIDAEAGIKCPVLKLIENADVIFLVAEYSSFGILDALRALKAIEELDKTCYLVINKFKDNLKLDLSVFENKRSILRMYKVNFEKDFLKRYGKGEISLDFSEKMPFLEVFP